MNDALFDTVRRLPLDVRLELLEVDPYGAGWFIDSDGDASNHPMPCEVFVRSPFRRLIDRGAAWLPSNPLAVIEVAARILANRHGLPSSIKLLGPDEDDGWTCRLVIARGVTATRGRRSEIGVRVLVEVVKLTRPDDACGEWAPTSDSIPSVEDIIADRWATESDEP